MRPANLKKHDKVAIVSTARAIDENEISAAIEVFRAWELEPVLGASIGQRHHQFAGDDETRLQDFQNALDDESIKAIICARGGYGTARIVDDIDFRKFSKHPKWIVGYSDVTALHGHIQGIYNIPSIHGIMPINVQLPNEDVSNSLKSLYHALFGKEVTYKCPNNILNRLGDVTAPIVGGNLSMLCSLINTSSDIVTDDCILFIEDLDEYLYHIDRMMVQLKRSNKLENLAGLVVGGFTKMKDNEIPFGLSAYEIIASHVYDYEYPVCFDFPAGHQDKNYAIRLGDEARLYVDEEGGIFKQ